MPSRQLVASRRLNAFSCQLSASSLPLVQLQLMSGSAPRPFKKNRPRATILAQHRGSNPREMMVTMSDGVILEHELARERGI